ncbi:MAG: hypothetical protein M0019_10285 [Actinomycetota bacterium]|nr:hypothetical protein [Actinomycetota bacterium]
MKSVKDNSESQQQYTKPIDGVVNKFLRIEQTDGSGDKQEQAQRLFSISMVISGFRCILSYVILPFLLPIFGVGATAGVGPAIGIPVGIVALAFDARGIRRFWKIGYRYKWQMTTIYLLVMALVTYLVVVDIVHLFSK